MTALDDLIVGSFVMFDSLMVTLSRNSALQSSDHSTLLITLGLYATAYINVRSDSTIQEAHAHAMQYVANHPFQQRLATQVTNNALDNIVGVK